MKLRRKHRPHFSGRGLGFLFGIVLALALLLVPMRDANSSVIKMPKPLPDIVKSYNSVTVNARDIGMLTTGVQVQEGDTITILAKGTINTWPSWTPGARLEGREITTNTGNFLQGPKKILVFRLNEKDPIRNYIRPELIEAQEKGNIYVGYNDGGLDSFGKPLKPEYYWDNTGALYVDIIIWKTKDPKLMVKFLEEASLAQPKDEILKEIAQEFKQRHEVLLGPQKKTLDGAPSYVIKTPRPLPDIVKNYKSVTVEAGIPGMHPTGVQVNQGDTITFLAKGKIDLSPGRGEAYIYGPKGMLLFLLKENDRLGEYVEPELIEIKENGGIYLGYRGSGMTPQGIPLNPQSFKNHTGSFTIDIIVWKTKDPDLIIKFLEQACLFQPDDKDFKEITQEFKKHQKDFAAVTERKAVGEKRETKQELPNSPTPVIIMPSPLPDIVKNYKSVTLHAKKPGMHNTGLQVKAGDFLTILAEGIINVFPERGKEYLFDPKRALLFRVGDKEFAHNYGGPEVVETPEDGNIYLGYVSSLMYFSGNPVRPEFYRDDIGAYQVDMIVWKTKDLNLIAKFFEESSLARPEDKTIKEVAQEFKIWQEKAKEAERVQRGLQALKELEDLKKKRSEPVIMVAYPKDGVTIDTEYINLYGVAEHEKEISKFEILLNDTPISLKDQRDVQLVPKGQKRIEFSEKIRLKEGQNKIAILVRSEDGAVSQKIISVQAAKKQDKVYAVVVGINKYKNFPSLKYATNDAKEFYRYLVEVNQIPKDQVWLLLDEEATLDKLRATLGTLLRRNAGKEDTVIIFLAGHGAAEQDVSSPDGDGLEKYILPSNADPKDLYASAMPMSEIARIFQRINSERLVFISDTCYSGASGGRTIPYPGMRSNISGAFLERISQGKGRVILTASEANELSVERDGIKHGVFTYYLSEGLRGKADLDKDGVVTVDEVYRYVSAKVPLATGQGQHPSRKGEVTGQIILGVVK